MLFHNRKTHESNAMSRNSNQYSDEILKFDDETSLEQKPLLQSSDPSSTVEDQPTNVATTTSPVIVSQTQKPESSSSVTGELDQQSPSEHENSQPVDSSSTSATSVAKPKASSIDPFEGLPSLVQDNETVDHPVKSSDRGASGSFPSLSTNKSIDDVFPKPESDPDELVRLNRELDKQLDPDQPEESETSKSKKKQSQEQIKQDEINRSSSLQRWRSQSGMSDHSSQTQSHASTQVSDQNLKLLQKVTDKDVQGWLLEILGKQNLSDFNKDCKVTSEHDTIKIQTGVNEIGDIFRTATKQHGLRYSLKVSKDDKTAESQAEILAKLMLKECQKIGVEPAGVRVNLNKIPSSKYELFEKVYRSHGFTNFVPRFMPELSLFDMSKESGGMRMREDEHSGPLESMQFNKNQ